MGKFIDLTGKVFSKLTVLRRVENTKTGSAKWLCLCECGKHLAVRGSDLRSNHTKSCGCLRVKHGDCRSKDRDKLYTMWGSMINRCKNPKQSAYRYYGGKGITVCEEWLDYRKFKEWALSVGYEEGLSIERINSNGNYEPSNCEFITMFEQRRRSHSKLTIEEVREIKNLLGTTSQSEIAKMYGVHKSTIHLIKRGKNWSEV